MTTLPAFPLEGAFFSGETVKVETLARGVMRLVLNRPQVRNAFNGRMIREFTQALALLATIADPGRMRLLMLEGEGGVFCAGADLAYMKEQAAAGPGPNLENARELGGMFAALASFPAPVVACVRGAAIGGGLGLAACSDFVLAEPMAVFATSEVTLGLVPAVISPYLVRRLGLAHAAPLMLTGRRILAPEAVGAGLVQRLVQPSETLEEALGKVLEEFLCAGPEAARATRALLLRIAPLPDPELFEATAAAIAVARASLEGQAGLQAFFDRTAAPWAQGDGGEADLTARLVIANRGEIARRILRAGRAMGCEVAVVSTAQDQGALVRREADAVLEVESFLDIPGIVAAARAWGGRLLHPGYGFLSEQAEFAQAVEDAGLAFVGPAPEAMRALGRKEPAKALARACGVPVLEALLSHELAAMDPGRWEAALAARGIVAPWLVKASGGGGGRGMRVVAQARDLPEAVRRAAQEAEAAFHDGTVFVERFLDAPRHIEVQVFGDGQGGGVFLGERECSLQRRHQKVLEETPSPAVDPPLREALGRAALALVRETRYRSAGTVEFLLDREGGFHFLEVNARLQVEHPVTELAYGVDLVQAQLELAQGRWPAALGDPSRFQVPVPAGVALEARVLAEDPRRGFLPTPGPLRVYAEPAGEGIRVDSGVEQGDRVNAQFDSMIAKLVVHGSDRAAAAALLSAALERFIVLGCVTNLPLLQAVSRHPDFLAGRESTRWIQDHLEELDRPLLPGPCLALLGSAEFRATLSCAFRGLGRPAPGPARRFAALEDPELSVGGRGGPGTLVLEPGPEPFRFTLTGSALGAALEAAAGASGHERGPGLRLALEAHALSLAACRLEGSAMALATLGETLELEDPLARLAPTRAESQSGGGPVLAPMAGKVLEVHAVPGDPVEAGQLLFVVESMKMQFEITAPRKGWVEAVLVEPGQVLQGPERLAVLSS